jgi:hypothetical protein
MLVTPISSIHGFAPHWPTTPQRRHPKVSDACCNKCFNKITMARLAPQDQRFTWSGFRFFLFGEQKRIGMYQKLHTFAAHKKGTLAQLVEQRTENPCVPGSIPGGTTTF